MYVKPIHFSLSQLTHYLFNWFVIALWNQSPKVFVMKRCSMFKSWRRTASDGILERSLAVAQIPTFQQAVAKGRNIGTVIIILILFSNSVCRGWMIEVSCYWSVFRKDSYDWRKPCLIARCSWWETQLVLMAERNT